MAVLDREIQTALDTTRDRYGRTVHHRAEATARARRNQTALSLYAAQLAPYADPLLNTAHSTLDTLPPARHTSAWRDLLDALATSHTEITGVLERPAAQGTSAEREQHAAMWPHLVFWAEHGSLAADLADAARLHQQPGTGLTAEERQMWTERAQAAQQRRELDLIESWYAADGRLITLAYLIEDDTDTVIALAGDPNAPGWEVIGQFANEYAASLALPRPVPPGVLRADTASRFNRPEAAPEQPLHDLLRDVIEARGAGDVSEALLSATQMGYAAGPRGPAGTTPRHGRRVLPRPEHRAGPADRCPPRSARPAVRLPGPRGPRRGRGSRSHRRRPSPAPHPQAAADPVASRPGHRTPRPAGTHRVPGATPVTPGAGRSVSEHTAPTSLPTSTFKEFDRWLSV